MRGVLDAAIGAHDAGEVDGDACCLQSKPGWRNCLLLGAVFAPLALSPVPRCFDGALPHAALARRRSPLLDRIGPLGVTQKIQCTPLTHEPYRNVLIAYGADRNEAFVAVAAAAGAGHCLLPDMLVKRIRAELATSPGLALKLAKLPAFGSINAPQANGLAMNLDRVSIYDRGLSGQDLISLSWVDATDSQSEKGRRSAIIAGRHCQAVPGDG